MKNRKPTYSLDANFRQKLNEFTDDFIKSGLKYFEHEFDNIDCFVEKVKNEDGTRDDHKLRLTEKEKYLLELISFRIYDEKNREAFNKTKDTLIVMPHCLSLHNPECEKVDTEYGEVCKRCMATCPAHKIVDIAAKYRAKVIFSKRKLTDQLKHFVEKSGDMGVIGIACILMLSEGMRTADESGIPSRGVLLNSTGCDHWNENPFGSEVTVEWLDEILKEKHEYQNKKT